MFFILLEYFLILLLNRLKGNGSPIKVCMNEQTNEYPNSRYPTQPKDQ